MNRVIVICIALLSAFATTGCFASSIGQDDSEELDLSDDRPVGTGSEGLDTVLREDQRVRVGHVGPGEERSGPFPDPWQSRMGPFPDPWQAQGSEGSGSGSNGSSGNNKP